MRCTVSDAWPLAFPGARVGTLLVANAENVVGSEPLASQLAGMAGTLRERYAGFDRAQLAELPTIRAYQQHYRRFGQTYHLLGQLESVVLKGRELRSPGGALVTAMFAAEIDHLLLTAGHDADVVAGDVAIDAAREGERFVSISGREVALKPGDMVMRDALGVISAVLSGPDQRTRLLPTSTRALYVTYVPAGIDDQRVHKHLDAIVHLVRLAQPEPQMEARAIYPG
ncbi:MAG TPA: hypothetical protein VGL99_03370 [Chloroflexota bacterium]